MNKTFQKHCGERSKLCMVTAISPFQQCFQQCQIQITMYIFFTVNLSSEIDFNQDTSKVLMFIRKLNYIEIDGNLTTHIQTCAIISPYLL